MEIKTAATFVRKFSLFVCDIQFEKGSIKTTNNNNNNNNNNKKRKSKS